MPYLCSRKINEGMKRIMTIICALAFSGAALSAQNAADTIKVSRNESDTLVIIVKEKNSATDSMSVEVQDSLQNWRTPHLTLFRCSQTSSIRLPRHS